MEITAWYDDLKRENALSSISEIYYYMVHATNLEERRNWAVEYTKMLGAKMNVEKYIEDMDNHLNSRDIESIMISPVELIKSLQPLVQNNSDFMLNVVVDENGQKIINLKDWALAYDIAYEKCRRSIEE